MTAGVVLPELEALSREAVDAHTACFSAARDALGHAIRAGEALLRARQLVPDGTWEEWVFANFPAPRMARSYMRIAHYKHLLPSDVQLTQIEALRYLKGLPSFTGGQAHHEVSLKEEGVRLLESGFSHRAVAEILDVNHKTVTRWVNGREPLQGARKRIRRKRRNDRGATQARKAEVLAQGPPIERAEVVVGLDDAYSYVLHASHVLRNVVRATGDAEARGAITDALGKLALAEDDVRVALDLEARAGSAT